mmetsp:Transcript_87638/g.253096  ORF Transcript_87638/g.253096 Transcript_87638/m.253096 type:complete len:157 (+) Transcript_87638:84-554(+)
MANEEDNQSEEAIDIPDIFYVPKKSLERLSEKVKKGEEVTQDELGDLISPEKVPDDEVMVPVDMRGVGQDFEDVDEMVSKLGPKGTVEAFVKAKAHFDASKDDEEDRPQEMTAAQWREVLAANDAEGEEEELLDEDLEEELDEEDGEPAAKKAKTG